MPVIGGTIGSASFHARAGDRVDLDALLLEHLQDADVGQPAGAAGRQREADPGGRSPPQRPPVGCRPGAASEEAQDLSDHGLRRFLC
jgi:hypothetical protein